VIGNKLTALSVGKKNGLDKQEAHWACIAHLFKLWPKDVTCQVLMHLGQGFIRSLKVFTI